MSRVTGNHSRRLAVATLVAVLAAAGAAVPMAAASAATAAAARAPFPAPASTAAVLAGLGVKSAPAELVFLIDLSDSMSQNGLYPKVQQALPAYMSALAAQAPQDHVDVITFGRMGSAQLLYTGPPTPDIGLPAVADEGSTDFGQAFALAVQQLGAAPTGTKIGGVLLMSDGKLDAFGDSQYQTYQSPGWAALRQRAATLPYKVKGYAVPLTTDQGYISNQQQALTAVFPDPPPQTLPESATNLSAALNAAGADILDSSIAAAAGQDAGKGVLVTWKGLPGPGSTPLDLRSPGHLDAQVTVRALTRRIPLYLTELSVGSPGLPFTASGLPSYLALDPGKSVTFPVYLAWPGGSDGWSLTGSTRSVSGRLALNGTVGSTYTPTLLSAYGVSYSAGALKGNTSTPLAGITTTTGVLIYIVGTIIGLTVLTGIALFRARLRGTLTLTSVDGDSGSVSLPGRPWASADTTDLLGIPGRVKVRRPLFGRRVMRVNLELVGLPPGAVDLEPGGRGMAAGIDVRHAGRW